MNDTDPAVPLPEPGSTGHLPPPPTERAPTPDAAPIQGANGDGPPPAGAAPQPPAGSLDEAQAPRTAAQFDRDLLRAIDARTDGLATELRLQRQQLIGVTVGIALLGLMIYLAARRGLRAPDGLGEALP